MWLPFQFLPVWLAAASRASLAFAYQRRQRCVAVIGFFLRAGMLISEWTTDEHGNMCRTITGI
jgi:hypothetical protein